MLRNRTRQLRQVHPARTGYHGNKLILSISGNCTNRFIPRNPLCTNGFSLVSGCCCCCCCFLLFFFMSVVCKFFAFCDFAFGHRLTCSFISDSVLDLNCKFVVRVSRTDSVFGFFVLRASRRDLFLKAQLTLFGYCANGVVTGKKQTDSKHLPKTVDCIVVSFRFASQTYSCIHILHNDIFPLIIIMIY